MRTPPTARPEVLDGIVAMLDDLPFFETTVQAAAFGLVAAMKAVPSLAGMALLRDESPDGSGGYVVVYARGATPGALELVRSRVPEDDTAIGAALVRGGPVSLEYGDGRRPPWRHTAFGDPWTSVIVPVHDEAAPGRCLGSLELVDPTDGRPLDDFARDTLATIARRLVELRRGRPTRAGDLSNVFAPAQLGLED
jgi:hypothetical protein